MEKTEHCAVIGVAVQGETQILRDLYEGIGALQHLASFVKRSEKN